MKVFSGVFSAILIVGLTGAAKAAPDPFAQACEARGTAPASCACQAKLARSKLDAAEQRAAVTGMRGDSAGLRKAVAAMGQAKADAFRAKLSALGKAARETCP